MYDYTALRVKSQPCNDDIRDLLAAFLAENEFETFESEEDGITAYVRKDKFDKDIVEDILTNFPMEVELEWGITDIKGEDWNKEWEQNYFKPITIEDKLVIRSSFHTDYPSAPIEILIDPKMAFGTGHHSTTAGMSRMLLATEMKNKKVIDMGTGTGILSILAKKLGAGDTTGIDIDEFAVENAKENGELNSVNVKWITGDDRALAEVEPADIFLANINLNVITGNLHKYVEKLKPGGEIFLSGFLTTDRDTIKEKAEKYGLKFVKEIEDNNWMTMAFQKGK